MKPHLEVVCALIERCVKVLIAKRPHDKDLAGKWEFPGGKSHQGEAIEIAIVREIEEELGCIVHPFRGLPPNTHSYPQLSITLIPLVCEIIDGTPTALEHAEIKWVVPEELSTYDWAEADIPIVEAYVASITETGS
jgi:8-oxo-dGTP diphosphatase